MYIIKEKLLELCACENSIIWLEANHIGTVEQGIALLWETDHSEKFNWSNWILSRVLNHHNQVKYAVNSAELVLLIWENEFPKDKRPHEAINAAKAWINDPSPENTEKCRQAAWSAAWAAEAAAGWAARAANTAYAASWAADNAAGWAAEGADLSTLSASRAIAADPTKAKEIIDYGLNLLRSQE